MSEATSSSQWLQQDFFTLFGLHRIYALNMDDLDSRYRGIQARVHPDRHAHLSDAERRVAMQWATHVNEAYQTLRSPSHRALYLLQLAGRPMALEDNTAMSAEFLMIQMEWREAVDEARHAHDIDGLDSLHRRLVREIKGRQAELGHALDAPDYDQAEESLRRLMFEEKLLQEIDRAIEAVEA
ncbi:MAG: Fe-S protein assembly co-chaperone HscB [Proteobacteria bacterium]|nr:Fe-S protein assembly co-chaperone HscB [Pseudomonadota bacterium]HQR04731.1 Fe-S protein assembly co-chaperone HscB [Rhodocyclaceae bacterium]